jgi:hypothetical protein
LFGSFEFIDDGENKPNANPLLVKVMEGDGEENIIWRSKAGDFRGFLSLELPVGENHLNNIGCVCKTAVTVPEHPDHITRIVGFNYRVERNEIVKTESKKWQEKNLADWYSRRSGIEQDLRRLMEHGSNEKIIYK